MALDMMFLDQYKKYYEHPTPRKEVKDTEYYLDKMMHFYGNFAHDSGTLIYAHHNYGPSRRTNWELRNYAKGLQPIEKYLYQQGYNKKEVQKFLKNNVSHQPLPIYPKYHKIMRSKFDDMNLQPHTEANDQQAQFEKLNVVNMLKFMKQPETQQNIPPQMMPTDPMPEAQSPSDVEFMFQIGGILLPVEIALKDAIDHTLDISKSDMIQQMNVEDLLDMAGMATDLRMINGELKLEYVDFTRVIVRSSIYPDFRDSDVRGYTAQRKISELMMEDEARMTENWEEIVQAYHGRSYMDNYEYRNSAYGYREDYSSVANPLYGYADFGVTVLKLYWLDVDWHYYVKGVHPRGSRIFERVSSDFTLSERGKRAGKELVKYPIQNMHSASWIVGTNIVFGEGPVDAIVRQGQPGSKRLVWPMQIMAAQEPSITEKVIPLIDDFQLSMMKHRDVISKMAPYPRMIFYKNRLQETITMGDETFTLKDIVKKYQREGIMILDEIDDYTMPGEELVNKQPPVEFIQTNAADELRMLQETMLVTLDRIREVTGINPLIDGTASKADILKTVAQSLQQSANNVLRPWLELYIQFYKNIYETIAWRYQILIGTGKIDLRFLSISTGFDRFKHIRTEILRYDLGIRIETVSAEYQQFLLQSLIEKREMLPPEAYFAVLNAIQGKRPDLRKAEFLLIKFVRQAQEAERQHQLALVERQAVAQAQSSAAVEQEKSRNKLMELQKQIELVREKGRVDEARDTSQHGRELEKIALKAGTETKGNLAVVEANKSDDVAQNVNQTK